MLTYKTIIDTCNTLDLDPKLQGGNMLARSRPLEVFKEPVDLKNIGFPDEERIQVEEIGKIIFNLLSQKKLSSFYVFGSKEMMRDKKIEKIIPMIESSQLFYFNRGLSRLRFDGFLKN